MFRQVNPKVNFPQMEHELLKIWEKEKLLSKYLIRNDGAHKRFSFFDGPITANNPMGVHHAWGRTYKDLWQRFKNMQGYKQRFQNGFDCQGLWVEVEVEKELGIKNKKEIEDLVSGDRKASIAKFIQLCKQRVLTYSKIQTEQSKRLGYFMNWENSYYTMSDENNYMIWYFLKCCFEKGWIYKGRDSVPWCPRCETAISQHEILTENYKDVTHETIFLKLPILNPHLGIQAKDVYLLVWTTTPWTVPANVAVGVNVKFTYDVWKDKQTEEAIIFIGKDADSNVPMRHIKSKEMAVAEYILQSVPGEFEKVKEISGKELLGLHYSAPFDDLPLVRKAKAEYPKTFHIVVDGSKIVTSGEGTGLLHVAPGAGKEDFDLGKEKKLAIISPIDDTGTYISDMNGFSEKNAKKHPEFIIAYLRGFDGGKFLLKTMHYTHRYPTCWRCKTELVWKVADEWYIAMDKPSKTKSKSQKSKANLSLRQRMIAVAKKIQWIPGFGLEQELDWLNNMHDWLISKKNRYWGLALPIYECSKCGSFEIIGSKEELAEKAVSGWEAFEGHSPHKPYIDEVKIKCSACGEVVSRVDDVGNVWLDAGIIPFSTLIDPKTGRLSYTTDKIYWKKWFPADFITESFPGQFKNWFYSMIAMSSVLEQTNPFRTILGYASVLAEDGRPMHKSWGNSVEFNEGADRIGVDVMRWMYVTADPEQNLLFGYKKADETRRKFHLLLWNIYNFFVTYANVDQWQATEMQRVKPKAQEAVGGWRMTNTLDEWIVSRLHATIRTVTELLEQYNCQTAALTIQSFVEDFSLWYIRRSRDRVGPTRDTSEDKDACYQTIYLVLLALVKLLAPFVPFLSDEIYRNLTNGKSVHLADYPTYYELLINSQLEKEMAAGRKLVSVILMKRKMSGIKVRIPLKKLSYTGPEKLSDKVLSIVAAEVNVYRLEYTGKSSEYLITTSGEDMAIPDNQDLLFGTAREIVRSIQEERKKLGTNLDEKVTVVLPQWPAEHEEYIKRQALVGKLNKGENFLVIKQ